MFLYTHFCRTAHQHTELERVQLLECKTPDFILPFLWPPNSLDLNPVDYKIWWLMQERVYKTNTDKLQEWFVEEQEWESLDQSVINCAIKEWCCDCCQL